MKEFDAIIIGSGQSGTPLAINMALKGKRVAFIEKNKLGGTCLNVGCTPTKTYVASARRMWDLAHSEDMGVDFEGSFKANLQKIKARKEKILAGSHTRIENDLNRTDNVTLIYGEAKFVSDYEIEVNGEKITAPQIFLNVGGRPFVPEVYSHVPYLTNRNIMELDEVPEHLIIIGGSYIGLEFGQIYKRFGSKITIIERSERIIGREDQEVSDEVARFFVDEGIEFVFNAKQIEAQHSGGQISITINGEQKIKGSHLLLAIGRTPNTDKLGLENTNINTNQRGYIEVDDYCETSVKGVFAMGDCNGKGAFTHTAVHDFQVVMDYIFGEKKRRISDRIVTYGLFVDPPLGRCGLTKAQAIEKGIKVLEGFRKMEIIARAKEKGETYGFMQILINAETEKIIGACILGVGGDEIITSILNVMYADKSYKTIRDSVAPHPTISELIPATLDNLKPVN